VLPDRFPIEENDYDRIIGDFKEIKFACIRCGSRDMEITGVEPYADGINAHSRPESSDHGNDIELTFYITGILFCRNCKHRFYLKILDQGIRNTDVYFDNTLE
jgi:transcription elongation factor Elf1